MMTEYMRNLVFTDIASRSIESSISFKTHVSHYASLCRSSCLHYTNYRIKKYWYIKWKFGLVPPNEHFFTNCTWNFHTNCSIQWLLAAQWSQVALPTAGMQHIPSYRFCLAALWVTVFCNPCVLVQGEGRREGCAICNDTQKTSVY